MARRREADKRQILPDPKFNDILVARFINSLLKQGKKSLAIRASYRALDRTLTDELIQNLHGKLVKAMEKELSAELR